MQPHTTHTHLHTSAVVHTYNTCTCMYYSHTCMHAYLYTLCHDHVTHYMCVMCTLHYVTHMPCDSHNHAHTMSCDLHVMCTPCHVTHMSCHVQHSPWRFHSFHCITQPVNIVPRRPSPWLIHAIWDQGLHNITCHRQMDPAVELQATIKGEEQIVMQELWRAVC